MKEGHNMKSVNEFIKSWAEKSPTLSLVSVVARDVLKGVEMYNYNLAWDQIDLLERVLGSLVTKYHNRDTDAELLLISVITLIISCGTANANQK